MLDESWQQTLTEDQRVDLVEWARRTIAGKLEATWRSVSAELAGIHELPEAERDSAISALMKS